MRKRTDRIGIYLSSQEQARLSALMAATGYTASALLRRLILDAPLPPDMTRIDALTQRLGEISASLERLATQAELRGFLDCDAYWRQAKEWEELRRETLLSLAQLLSSTQEEDADGHHEALEREGFPGAAAELRHPGV